MASNEGPKPLRSALKRHDSDEQTAHSPGLTRIPLPPSPTVPSASLPPSPLPLPESYFSEGAPIFNRTASSPPQTVDKSSDAPAPAASASGGIVRHASPPPLISRTPPRGAHRPATGGAPPPLQSAMHVRHASDSTKAPGSATTTTTVMSSGAKTPYTPKVSFDTFENPLASMFSFTLQVKSAGYKRTHHTRVYLCAASPDESGQQAMDWCLESLAQDGDEVIVFRGLDEEVMEKDHDILRENAREIMRTIQAKVAEVDASRTLSLILEYVPGKVTDTIDRLIALYRPDSLVVGTRGKRGIMAIGMGLGGIGSVSKYCLSHSPVPVIVVRPERQLKKAVEKRKADPKRGRHFD